MIKPWQLAAALLIAASLLAACAGPQERVILLPDPSGHVGRIEVSSSSGTTQLTEAYSAARIEGKTIAAETIGEENVKRRYGQILEGLPSSPHRHILNFESGTNKLTAQSRAMVPGIINDFRQFPAPEVIVEGHTDAMGEAAFNDKLSLDRANSVRNILVEAGISPDAIQTVGRGSRSLLVAEQPGVPDPKNRRVEIKLR